MATLPLVIQIKQESRSHRVWGQHLPRLLAEEICLFVCDFFQISFTQILTKILTIHEIHFSFSKLLHNSTPS